MSWLKVYWECAMDERCSLAGSTEQGRHPEHDEMLRCRGEYREEEKKESITERFRKALR